MISKIIILKEGYMSDKTVFNEKGKTYILTTENETIPVSILGIVKGEFEIVYAGNGTKEEYAFYLGQLYVQNKNAKLYTDDDVLKMLFEGSLKSDRSAKPARKLKKTEDTEKINVTPAAPVEKKQEIENPVTEDTKTTKEPAKRGRKARTKQTEDEKLQSASDDFMNTPHEKTKLSGIKRAEIEKLLKDNSFDVKYVPAIMEALSTANEVTADILVRTKVALIEEDQPTVVKLGELIKKTYC